MSAVTLPNIQACVFDAYGTLFDYASAAEKCRAALGEKFATFTAQWRERQLQYTWLRSLQGRHADFWQVTGDALDHTLETLGIDDVALHSRLMQLYLELDVFPEVPAMLRRLKDAGKRTAILSNGTPAMLNAIVAHARIGDLLDEILSVEEVGVYKTHPRVYQLALDRLALPAEAISFQSSNGWDAWAASAFGMRVVWCNRYGQKPERMPGKPDVVVKSLADLPAIVGV